MCSIFGTGNRRLIETGNEEINRAPFSFRQNLCFQCLRISGFEPSFRPDFLSDANVCLRYLGTIQLNLFTSAFVNLSYLQVIYKHLVEL